MKGPLAGDNVITYITSGLSAKRLFRLTYPFPPPPQLPGPIPPAHDGLSLLPPPPHPKLAFPPPTHEFLAVVPFAQPPPLGPDPVVQAP